LEQRLMVTFEVDAAALAEAHRRGTREVLLPAAWLVGCLVGLLLLPAWTVPLLLPLALVFGLLAVVGLLRLRRTRRPANDTLTVSEAGVQYAGAPVDWSHVRSVVAHPNSERLEVRTGCPQPLDGPGCTHPRGGGQHWAISAELFGTSIDSLTNAFGHYVPVDERELLSDDRLRSVLGRRPGNPGDTEDGDSGLDVV
jgi:hypothetical protein